MHDRTALLSVRMNYNYEQEELLPGYPETEQGIELKSQQHNGILELLEEGSSGSQQRILFKYRWVKKFSIYGYRSFDCEYSFDPETPLADAVDFALAQSPPGADWSNKVILRNHTHGLSYSRLPLSSIFEVDQQSDESGESTRWRPPLQKLYICSESEYHSKKAFWGFVLISGCVTLFVFLVILFAVVLNRYATAPYSNSS